MTAHRPTVEKFLEPYKFLQPECSCGWSGMKVVQSFLNLSEDTMFGGRVIANALLKEHVTSFSRK